MDKMKLNFEQERLRPPSPRTLKNRVELLQGIINTVKGNIDLDLNNDMDSLFKTKDIRKSEALKRANSMRDLRLEVNLLDDEDK